VDHYTPSLTLPRKRGREQTEPHFGSVPKLELVPYPKQ
jgi:hypothetical protein